jgi:hypothetical protein
MMSRLFAGLLWISLGTSCGSPVQPGGTDGSLRVSCEWPRMNGLQAVAIVPILVVRDGQIVARSFLVRDNPSITLGGMTAGPVRLVAAALAGDAAPLLADEVDAVIKAKDTTRVVLDLQPQNVTPERLTIFGPLMGELRRLAADIAAHDAAFIATPPAQPSEIPAIPAVPLVPQVGVTPVQQQVPNTGVPVGAQGTYPVGQGNVPNGQGAAQTGQGTGQTGGGGAPAQPQPTPTPTPSTSSGVPWGSVPGIPLGSRSPYATPLPTPSSHPWGVPGIPAIPNASVPPVSL